MDRKKKEALQKKEGVCSEKKWSFNKDNIPIKKQSLPDFSSCSFKPLYVWELTAFSHLTEHFTILPHHNPFLLTSETSIGGFCRTNIRPGSCFLQCRPGCCLLLFCSGYRGQQKKLATKRPGQQTHVPIPMCCERVVRSIIINRITLFEKEKNRSIELRSWLFIKVTAWPPLLHSAHSLLYDINTYY